jgi:glycosyltransferase involved in cell wall biosynthesis
MRVLILSDVNSPHTIKWVKSLISKGIDVQVFSFGDLDVNDYDGLNIKVHSNGFIIDRQEGSLSKLKYIFSLFKVIKVIKVFKPDIVHAHYASSYGLLGALTFFRPYVLSVWGSDVFSFPKISFVHNIIFKFNLFRATRILSTSNVMAVETSKYTKKTISVTPFGINLEVFKKTDCTKLRTDLGLQSNDIVIGTVKTLEKKYGVEYLITAFSLIEKKLVNLNLKLLIVGGGGLRGELENLVTSLNLDNKVIFTGKVKYSDVPFYHNVIDIGAYLSISDCESFGVSVIEASSSGVPVVVSNVGGLPEVVVDNVTGIVVPPMNQHLAANAIEKLILDLQLREDMGISARAHVIGNYNWNDNLSLMTTIYDELVG